MAFLRAYEAHDGDEGCCVVFAKTEDEARQKATRQMDAEPEWCRRAPAVDRFAPGPVPEEALIEDLGWRFECSHCDAEVSDETDHRVYSRQTNDVFCCPGCALAYAEEIVQRRLAKEGEIARLKSIISEKFPDAVSEDDGHFYSRKDGAGKRIVINASLKFRFPGGMPSAELWHDGKLFVTNGDLDAWNRYRGV